jgi:hypothetical protein
MGSKKMSVGSSGADNENGETFIVGRNFIVAALVWYAKDHMANTPFYTSKY